jgi:hypothetical protein
MSLFTQGDNRIPCDDHVIEKVNSEDGTCCCELAGYLDVLPAWGGVS